MFYRKMFLLFFVLVGILIITNSSGKESVSQILEISGGISNGSFLTFKSWDYEWVLENTTGYYGCGNSPSNLSLYLSNNINYTIPNEIILNLNQTITGGKALSYGAETYTLNKFSFWNFLVDLGGVGPLLGDSPCRFHICKRFKH